MLRLICCLIFLIPTTLSASEPFTHGIVVSESQIASKVGADILKQGGNAIDAALAVGYALAVVTPCCGNIGGGGFMTIHLATGKNVVINFREMAPSRATPNMFLDQRGKLIPHASTNGYLAVAIPGTVLGFETARKHYGTLSREIIMAPAIQLAEQGFVVSPYLAQQFLKFAEDFRQDPNVAAIFLKENRPYQAGARFIQKDLAKTLSEIARHGADYFYRGPIAKAIIAESEQHHGILTLTDFQNYKVQIITPITCTYHDYTLITPPPPSAGGVTLCEMLNILENFSLNNTNYDDKKTKQILIETMRQSFNDRNSQLGDPDFVSNPINHLLSKKYAQEVSTKISKISHAPSTTRSTPEHELTDTTHYSVLDKKGNAVAVTYTINGFFGARVIADHTGFFLNDEMDDFTSGAGISNKFNLVQSEQNKIAGLKRPLSSMTPTIILKNKTVWMVLGSPGGPRIITSILLTILNVMNGMPLQLAIDAPRLHFQGNPNVISLEPHALNPEVMAELINDGYQFKLESKWGAVEAIAIDPITHQPHGANDVRRSDGGVAID